MGQHAERLGQPPLRESVGRITLVVDGKRRHEGRILQIRIEFGHLLGQHHALVDHRPAGQAAQVERRDLRGGCGFFDPAADHIKLALEGFLVCALGVLDQDLLDLGARGIRLFPQNRGIDRHMTPAIDVVAHAQHFAFDDRAAAFLRAEIGARQEHLPDGDQRVHVGLMPGAADLVVEERNRDLQVNARAVAGLSVGVHGAPVPDGLQGVDPAVHDFAAGPAVNRHHQSDTAG